MSNRLGQLLVRFDTGELDADELLELYELLVEALQGGAR